MPGVMRDAFRILSAALLLFAMLAAHVSADDRQPLEIGTPIASELVSNGDSRVFREFRLDVSPDAVSLTLSLSGSPVPLEILVRDGGGTILAVHDSGTLGQDLELHRLGNPALPTGPLLVEVSYQPRSDDPSDIPPRIPFMIEARVADIELVSVVRPGAPVSGILDPERGMVGVYAVDVPANARVLRFDVAGAAGALDLYAFYEDLRGDLRSADHRSTGPLGQESLIIGGDSGRTLLPGRWYVAITDPFARRFLDSFELYTRFDEDPPEQLLEFPELSRGREGLAGVLDATVQVITPAGNGSGVLIGNGGYLLTNDHVLAGVEVGGLRPVIAMTLDPGVPPRELFRAIIVERDPVRDLALVRIESGLYGQPLPSGYRFPAVPVASARELEFGDSLTFTGYPRFGGRGSRATITVSRGIVAGFEVVPEGLVLKTDAAIGPGNSGGAAVNSRYELVGLPAEVMGLGSSGIGYIISSGMIPPRWLVLAGVRNE
ncbi:MAG: serine protease [Spirochaetaceae bacterium]